MSEELKELLEFSEIIRERIISECRITNATFLNWKKDITPIPFWAKERINAITEQIVGKKVFANENN